jgi:hypothetical protein
MVRPDIEERVGAVITADDEVIAEVAAPFRRWLRPWSEDDEGQLRDAVRDLARSGDMPPHEGPVSIVFDPGINQDSEDLMPQLHRGRAVHK